MSCFFSIISFLLLTRFFGFWGIIIWFILISITNNFNKISPNNNIYTNERLLVLFDNIIRVFSYLVLEDQIVTKEEVSFVKNYFIQLFPNNPDFINTLMKKFKFYNENPQKIEINNAIYFLKKLNYNEKLAIFSVIVNLSKYSGGETLKNKIFDIGKQLNINAYEILSIWNFYYVREEKEKSNKYYYDILGLNENANKEEIKKRYKELAKKYHPDRLRNMPKSFQKDSEEKLKKINEAYNALK